MKDTDSESIKDGRYGPRASPDLSRVRVVSKRSCEGRVRHGGYSSYILNFQEFPEDHACYAIVMDGKLCFSCSPDDVIAGISSVQLNHNTDARYCPLSPLLPVLYWHIIHISSFDRCPFDFVLSAVSAVEVCLYFSVDDRNEAIKWLTTFKQVDYSIIMRVLMPLSRKLGAYCSYLQDTSKPGSELGLIRRLASENLSGTLG